MSEQVTNPGNSSHDRGTKLKRLINEYYNRLPQLKSISRISGDTLLLDGAPYASSSHRLFSGDASSLYTVLKLTDTKGKTRDVLYKLGWGEFSKDFFENPEVTTWFPDENGAQRILKNFPLDIYCVSQHSSYFADEKTKIQQLLDPKKYLAKKALFVARRKEDNSGTDVIYRDKDEYPRKLLSPLPVEIPSYTQEEFIKALRDAALKFRFERSGQDLVDFINSMPRDFETLKKYASDNNLFQDHDFMRLIRLGVVDDGNYGFRSDESLKSLIELLNKFNPENLTFDR